MKEDRSVESARHRDAEAALDRTEPALAPLDPKPTPAIELTPDLEPVVPVVIDGAKPKAGLVRDATINIAKQKPELVHDAKPSPLTALNALNRQLAKMNAALTELHFASERSEATSLMLARINTEWDLLDERLKVLAEVSLDHEQWTRRPVEMVYGRLHQLLERGIVCSQNAAQEANDLQEFHDQLCRLAQRVLINWDVNQRRRDERTRGDDLTGRTMGGFVLRGRIGEGGHGEVYSCEQPLLGREAVVKVLHRDLRRSSVLVQRFLREARLASRLDHPYAAHVYAFGIEEQDRLLWIAMERVHGVTLAEWLRLHGPMPLGQFVSFFERIAAVVQTAHERGIVHRDLKPSNVMVIERAGELLPKLLDFGVAKLLDHACPAVGIPGIDAPPLLAMDDSDIGLIKVARASGKSTVSSDSAPPHGDDGRLTQNNHTIGSPPYISPEQWSNSTTVGPASDLYALAVVAFEALTGHRPFHGETVADYADAHCLDPVPPLGGNFPSALDRMFERALAKRPEDRWGTALELAAALRAASGIGATRSDLPRIDRDVRDAWLAEAPQSLAESLAQLDDAHNAHQARDLAAGLIRALLRYLLVLTLVLNARVHEDRGDPVLLELVRALDRRKLGVDERVGVLRLLARRLTGAGGHLALELLDLVTSKPDGPDGKDGPNDGLDLFLALDPATDHAATEEAVRLQLMRLLPELTQVLRRAAFVLDYVLVVSRDHAAERWVGRRRQPRALANVFDGELVEGHPTLLDRAGRVCVDLWPLVQVVSPTDDAEPELFLFDGHGRDGALLIATPSGLERHDAIARSWVSTHVIAEIEARTRMRDQLQVTAQQWQDRGRPAALLWRGEVLADLERWMRHMADAALGELEAVFVAASRRAGRRSRWGRRVLIAVAVATALVVVANHVVMKQRMAEEIAEQAEVEQGRQALLHDDIMEAWQHLAEAYRRGDHSPSVAFMLARALQPRLAEQARFAATAGRVWSAVFSPDSKQVVTADDNAAQIWDARTYQLRFTLPHGDTVYDARYSTDGARLVTAGGDGIVRIWDPATGTLMRELRHDGPTRSYYATALSPDGKLIAAITTSGAVVHIWDSASGALLAELPNDAAGGPRLAFSSDGQWLASSGGNDVRVFNVRTWSEALAITGPHIRTLSFDPTGPRLATGTAGGDASIWEVPSGTRTRHLREIGDPVNSVAFSPDGQLVAAGGDSGAVQVFRATTGTLQSQFSAMPGRVLMAEFDPASRLVVAASDRGTVVVANATLGVPETVLEGTHALITAAHFDPASHRVVGASWDGTARVWDAISPYRVWSSSPIADDCGLTVSLEPDGRFLAIGCRDRATRIWDTGRDQLLAELPSVTPVAGNFASAFPAVDAAGDRAAIARGSTVEIYALPGGQLLRTIRHGAPVNAVAFGPTGHDLVSGATDGSLLVTRDDREPIALPASSGGVDAAAILPDGRVVAANAHGHLQFYDPDRNVLLADLDASARVRVLRLSPDGIRLLAIPWYTGKAGSPRLWDLVHYQLIAQLEGHTVGVFSARFTPSGVVTVGGDGVAQRWERDTGRLLQTYRSTSLFLADAVIDPERSMLIASGSDGLLWFWDLATGRPLWTLRAHRSHIIGIHFEGSALVTRGFGGEVARWTLPSPERVIEAMEVH
jgi:WD40 repeat protein/serine/threonine protein kinase